MKKKRLPRYTEPGRYAYHFACTEIIPTSHSLQKRAIAQGDAATWLKEGTHTCWCSSWKQLADGTFLQWQGGDKDGGWRLPARGAIKSKPIEAHQ